jgi:hypothetical protein
VWSHAWAADNAALELLPNAGFTRFAAVKPPRCDRRTDDWSTAIVGATGFNCEGNALGVEVMVPLAALN